MKMMLGRSGVALACPSAACASVAEMMPMAANAPPMRVHLFLIAVVLVIV
jgi:hypothetical protein